jgi:hypothetical protein
MNRLGAIAVAAYIAGGLIICTGLMVGRVLMDPVPRCQIVNGIELDNHHCIPYCPPDPKECD